MDIIDEELEEIKKLIEVPDEPLIVKHRRRTPPKSKRIATAVTKVLCVFFETVLLLCIALCGVMYVLAKGPSPAAKDLFVLSVRETSAMGWLANLYFTEEEIAEIESAGDNQQVEDTDTTLIEIPQRPNNSDSSKPQADAWGLIDEDGDGIILENVQGIGFRGYMMVVLDPSRVIMGTDPSAYGNRGFTVEEMVNKFDAVAGINAGGFQDEGGNGDGSVPDTMVVYGGNIYYPEFGCKYGYVGIDNNNILHVGNFSAQEAKDKNFVYGTGYGPVLVSNGKNVAYKSGVNPRTAIGQRSDGAILMLVVEGRKPDSLGATFVDLAEVFLSYGAVNACNLDGGMSSALWYEDHYVNDSAALFGIRPVCTTFLVMKKEG